MASEEGQCVSVLSLRGEKLRSFGKFGDPSGVEVDGDGNILVSDTHKHQVLKFTSEGQLLATVGNVTHCKGPLEFNCPVDIVFNPTTGKVCVVSLSSNYVQILNSDLSFSSIFGEEGSGKGQFSNPRGIACDSTGRMYVTDFFNYCIHVFTTEGEFLRMFGKHPPPSTWAHHTPPCTLTHTPDPPRGELRYPTCIAIDSCDLVYVTEDQRDCVSVFTTEGQYVLSFGSGMSSMLTGLAVHDSGVVYVSDYAYSCVHVL